MDAMSVETASAIDAAPPPFAVEAPSVQTIPFVFSSPHSGTYYPTSFRAQSRLDAFMLRRSEDSFVDEIFSRAPAHGAPLIKATYARAYLDLNREPFELDPAMFHGDLPGHVNASSPRVTEGLGTIARIVASGAEIYRGKLDFADAEDRLATIYRPYHEMLDRLVAATRLRFGCAVMVDCHSMPSAGANIDGPDCRRVADIILGDRHGTACSRRITDVAEGYLRSRGYSVTRNLPYAGGYNTKTHGRPDEGIHALQIEISRHLYMNQRLIERGPNFDLLRRDMTGLMTEFSAIDTGRLAAR